MQVCIKIRFNRNHLISNLADIRNVYYYVSWTLKSITFYNFPVNAMRLWVMTLIRKWIPKRIQHLVLNCISNLITMRYAKIVKMLGCTHLVVSLFLLQNKSADNIHCGVLHHNLRELSPIRRHLVKCKFL